MTLPPIFKHPVPCREGSKTGQKFVPFENFKTEGRRIPGAHRSSGRDDRPSSSLFALRNTVPMMHGAVTAADLDHRRGWLLEGASHFSSRGALAVVLFAAGAHDLLMRSRPVEQSIPLVRVLANTRYRHDSAHGR